MSIGYQITQTAHVIAELAVAHPEIFRAWHSVSSSIIALQVKDAKSLIELYSQAQEKNITVEVFREPDLGDEITALAFLPGSDTVAFLSQLPLAGKNICLETQKEIVREENAIKRVSFDVQYSKEFAEGIALREHYFAYLDHLRGRVNLENHSCWSFPETTQEDKQHILDSQPSLWIMDRALTFYYLPASAAKAYAHADFLPQVLDAIENCAQIPGMSAVLNAHKSLETCS